MTKGTPEFDPQRYELQEDPRKTRLINWLDSLAACEIPDLTFEQLYILARARSLFQAFKTVWFRKNIMLLPVGNAG